MFEKIFGLHRLTFEHETDSLLKQPTFSTNPLSNFFHFRRFQALSVGQSKSGINYQQVFRFLTKTMVHAD